MAGAFALESTWCHGCLGTAVQGEGFLLSPEEWRTDTEVSRGLAVWPVARGDAHGHRGVERGLKAFPGPLSQTSQAVVLFSLAGSKGGKVICQDVSEEKVGTA